MTIDFKSVARLQGVVHRLTKTPQPLRNLNDRSSEEIIKKCKQDSISVNDLLLEPPFARNTKSRFSKLKQGLFYGSRSREGCLVEAAYYLLFFYEKGSDNFGPETKRTETMTLFQVKVDSENCLQLHQKGDESLQAKLRDPIDYRFVRDVGAQMREAGVTCFEYFSARSPQLIVNFGAFTSQVFSSPPFNLVNVTTTISRKSSYNDAIEFICHDDNRVWQFTREQYEVNGQLPPPPTLDW